MIPKRINYCWFGKGKKSKLVKRCMKSWKKNCPDYQIIEWNEDNIDFSIMPDYVKESYDAKKWGFVPDFIRLWIVYNYGGIYLDTDVEVIRSFDELLKFDGFAGFESETNVALGLGFGAKKGNQIIKYLMESYCNLHFKNADGSLNMIPSPVLNTKTLCQIGLKSNGKKQEINGFVFFPVEYFCPLDPAHREMIKTVNTYSIHWYDASWFDEEMKKEQKAYLSRYWGARKEEEKLRKHLNRKRRLRSKIASIVGEKNMSSIISLIRGSCDNNREG